MNTSLHQLIGTMIVDRSGLFREGLMRILSGSRFQVIAESATLRDLPVKSGPEGEPALMLLGMERGSAEALKALSSIKACHEQLRVVMLSDQPDPDQLFLAIESGADGYLLKQQVSADTLLKSIALVLDGGSTLPRQSIQLGRGRLRSYVDPASKSYGSIRLQQVVPPRPPSPIELDESLRLSEKEGSVLWHLAQGEPNKLIARDLHIAEATVKVHVKAILCKIRARNRTQAAMWAMNNMAQALGRE
jgi:two-component system nitrate/nitrite response regulator NarL